MSVWWWWRRLWETQTDDPATAAGVFAPSSPPAAGYATPLEGAEALLAGPAMKPAGILRTQRPELLFSRQRLQQAWLAVKQAGGGVGIDGVTLAEFARPEAGHLERLRRELVAGSYKPHPVRQVLVPKPGGGLRALGIWALRDRVAQRAVYDLIAPSFEAIFLPCSFGFRPGRSVADAVRQVCAHRDQHLRWILDGDIYHCFDEIDSTILMPLVRRRVRDPLLLRYIHGWLKADIFNSLDGVSRQAGVGQGSVLSPLLANVYLHEMDVALTRQGLALVRYADDFVVCCRRKSEADAARQAAAAILKTLRLRLRPDKTGIVHLDEGLEWLGYFLLRNECYALRRTENVGRRTENGE